MKRSGGRKNQSNCGETDGRDVVSGFARQDGLPIVRRPGMR